MKIEPLVAIIPRKTLNEYEKTIGTLIVTWIAGGLIMDLSKYEKVNMFYDGEIVEYGVRLDDSLFLKGIYGKQKEIKLNRTEFNISTCAGYSNVISGTSIGIAVTNNQEISYSLVLCGSEGKGSLRYFLQSNCDLPFKVNGSISYASFIKRGDKVVICNNELHFKETVENQTKIHTIPIGEKEINSALPILLEGETGTGKTYMASEIHKRSKRYGEFTHINLSAYSSSLIESEIFGHVKGAFTGAIGHKQGALSRANNGTLFLDEIDSISYDLQTKLLLFLDSNRFTPVGGTKEVSVDVRIIFASGSILSELCKKQQMRTDFFYRVNSGFTINLKPLRESPEKISNFIRSYSLMHEITFDRRLVEFYKKLDWPGNFRQLKGHLDKKRVVDQSRFLKFSKVDEELSHRQFTLPTTNIASLKSVKDNYIISVFHKLGNNINRTAELLEVSKTLIRSILKDNNLYELRCCS